MPDQNPADPAQPAGNYVLECYSDGRATWRVEVAPLPFKVGRRESCDLRLPTGSVSSEHAVLDLGEDGSLVVSDLGSTNGTFVNLRRVGAPVSLAEGDVVHFADQEFRLVGQDGVMPRSTAAVSPDVISAMRGSVERRAALEGLLATGRMDVVFQPIVDLSSEETVAWESLAGRGGLGLFAHTGEVFEEASRLELCCELSETLRASCGLELEKIDTPSIIYFNIHPVELDDATRLLASIDRLSEVRGAHRLMFEVHEMAVTDVDEFSGLRAALAERGIGLAFDDFGKGRSRFLELAELKPEVVKFDRATIAGGARLQNPSLVSVLQTLVSMVHDMGSSALAEGIETAEELAFCRELGFDLAQGFLFGRPRPAGEAPTHARSDVP